MTWQNFTTDNFAIIPYQELLGNYDCVGGCGGGQRIDIFAAAMQRRRKLPITIGAYGEGGAPIDNDG